MANANDQATTREESAEFGHGSNRVGESASLSASWIIVYLALFPVWAEFVRIDYSFVVFRLLFLFAVCAALWRQGNAQAIPSQMFGHLPSRWTDTPALVVIPVFLVLAHVACECFWRQVNQAMSFREFIDVIIVAPINEEVVFRGLFLGILLQLPGWNKPTAIIVSALIFLGTHQDNGLNGLFWRGTLGLALGYAYTKTKSVLACILGHMAWNLCAYCPILHPAKPGEAWFFYMRF